MKIKLNNLFVIFGCSHSGTNLLWNIVQSHPDIITIKMEYNQLLYKKDTNFLFRLILFFNYYFGVKVPLANKLIEKNLINLSTKYTLKDKYNSYKKPHIKYKKKDFEENINLVIKITYHPTRSFFFNYFKKKNSFNYINQLKNFKNLKIIFIAKSKKEQVDSWNRRSNQKDLNSRFFEYFHKNKKFIKNNFNSIELRAKDITKKPFHIQKKIFSFLKILPTSLNYLRIKIKSHKKNLIPKNKNKKIWLNQKNFRKYIL
tara:strand:- start:1041 stop:1814 length:774 start_codon:yes stop_codon:yes gene_type:complete